MRPLSLLASHILAVGTVCAAPSLAAAAPVKFTKGPYVQQVTATSAEIRVELDQPAPLTVQLGSMGDAGNTSFVSREAKTFHIVPVAGLEPGRAYEYSVKTGGKEAALKSASFATAPRESSGAPFRFLIYGDNRSDDETHAAVVAQMKALPGEFLLNTGDFVADGGDAAQWQRFFDIESPLLAMRPLVSCVGNHELTDRSATAYRNYFGPSKSLADAKPELSGSNRWSNARFFLVNAMTSYAEGSDRTWLERELEKSDSESDLVWRIVVMHHGLWSSGPHAGNVRMLEAGIPELLKKHHVDLVISGHDHIYERGASDGMPYLVSGGGGAPLYKFEHDAPGSKKRESVHHVIAAEATRDKLSFTVTRLSGTVLERCALVKGKGWDCDPPPAPKPAMSSSGSGPSGDKGSSCGCETPGSAGSPAFASGFFAVLLAWSAGMRRRRSSSFARNFS